MPHKYSSYIELLPEKADAWRNFCICISCSNNVGRPVALLNKIVNKKERVLTHLKKCNHFKNLYPEKFVEFFGSETESENTVNSKKRPCNNSVSTSTSQTSMYLKINNLNKIYKILMF